MFTKLHTVSIFIAIFMAILRSTSSYAQIPENYLDQMAADLASIYESGLSTQDGGLGWDFRPLKVTADNATIFAGASSSANTIQTLPSGTDLFAVDKADDWYAVALQGGQSGWINASDVAPMLGYSDPVTTWYGAPERSPSNDAQEGDWLERKVLELLQKANDFREAYRNSPYVSVDGFNVSMSLTGPTLGIAFSFKE